MARYNKMSKDLINNMLYMREHEKMCNKEIADSLGISAYTVLKYIGKQPVELNRPKGGYYPRPSNADKAKNTEPMMPPLPETYLIVQNMLTEVKSERHSYVVDRKAQTVEIDAKYMLDYNELNTFIAELMIIRRTLGESIGVPLDMWTNAPEGTELKI